MEVLVLGHEHEAPIGRPAPHDPIRRTQQPQRLDMRRAREDAIEVLGQTRGEVLVEEELHGALLLPSSACSTRKTALALGRKSQVRVTFPGASASRRFVVMAATTTVAI